MECNGGVHNVTQDDVLLIAQPHTSSETIMTTVVLPLIAVLGVLSNGAFIFVVSRLPHMRTPTNYYLVSLAVADIMDVCAGVGDKLLLFLSSPISPDEAGYGGPAGCMLANFITNTSYFTTLFLITLVSLEKFYAVCHPMRVARGQAGRRAVRAITCAGMVAVLLSLTFLPTCGVKIEFCLQWPQGSDHASSPSTVITYSPPYDWMSTYTRLCRTFPFFATLVANFVFYIRIIRALGRQVAAMESHGQANVGAGPHARNMVARMLVVTGTAYFVLLAPLEVTQLCFLIGYFRGHVYVLDEHQASILFQVVRILSYINSASNPFIYGVINRKYREAYKLALRCKQQ
ncbi:neuromedin-U receptor 2-like [Patiria miniata]|uniref:G-protein coupled receptors family 1 profile domain-containing protein n=1 Tax=Patiria miniata TaxID=46514 RepID=A0A913ZUQ3_PATMI|nr:neuromedin-U receptor 2-like [Patiria miniata]